MTSVKQALAIILCLIVSMLSAQNGHAQKHPCKDAARSRALDEAVALRDSSSNRGERFHQLSCHQGVSVEVFGVFRRFINCADLLVAQKLDHLVQP